MDAAATRLDLRELALRGGDRFERTYFLEMAPIVMGGQSYRALIPDGVDVTVDRVAGGFLVNVSLVATLYGPCGRCLGEARVEVRAQQQEFVPTTKGDWDESDVSPFIEDFVADISGLAREATVLAVPSQVLCSQECLGLCPVCGKDLNSGPCECPPPEGDERWATLREIALDE
jgi:uncharacterized protein